MSEYLEKEIILIISEISGVDEEEIKLDSNFATDLEFDSIKSIELVVALEKKYKVSIRDEDIPKIATVKQVIDITGQLIEQNTTP
ncbi:MAG: acyl carrier protein [Thermodesulfovibrionales bacterium]